MKELFDIYQKGAWHAFLAHYARIMGKDVADMPETEFNQTAHLAYRWCRARFEAEIMQPIRDLGIVSGPALGPQVIQVECNYAAMLLLMEIGTVAQTVDYDRALESRVAYETEHPVPTAA